jgi:uncharacterized membrane protein YeaQ/YmgE (transglycosylase-associated protein family)
MLNISPTGPSYHPPNHSPDRRMVLRVVLRVSPDSDTAAAAPHSKVSALEPGAAEKELAMEIGGLISAVVIGAIIGTLGRIVVPGRQHISLLMTLLVGIVAALLGTAAASVLGVANTAGVDWVELALQIGLAAGGVALLSGARSRSRTGR